jgi:hypothetical protein
MLAVICLSAVLDAIHLTPEGAKPRPAPVVDRWLLKYAPEDLPKLPGRFFDIEWHHGFYPRSLRGGFTEWTKFARDSLTPPRVTVTHSGSGFDVDERSTTVRRVPLAVQGPLVEFDGNLHTVEITNWQEKPTEKPRWALNIGAAVEVKKNVWYQAGSEQLGDGKIRVREYRLEFADDPRTSNTGKVKVFGSERLADRYEGETTEADAEFVAAKDERPPRQITITFGSGKKGRRDVRVQIGDGYYPSVIHGVSRTSHPVLTEAPSPAPKPTKAPDPPGLMQPPKKTKE